MSERSECLSLFSHAIVFIIFIICSDVCACVALLPVCFLYLSLRSSGVK